MDVGEGTITVDVVSEAAVGLGERLGAEVDEDVDVTEVVDRDTVVVSEEEKDVGSRERACLSVEAVEDASSGIHGLVRASWALCSLVNPTRSDFTWPGST